MYNYYKKSEVILHHRSVCKRYYDECTMGPSMVFLSKMQNRIVLLQSKNCSVDKINLNFRFIYTCYILYVVNLHYLCIVCLRAFNGI